jgi:Zn-dependent membrane protease YugP
VQTARNVTGAQVARTLLDSNGLHNVQIEKSRGLLSDHYDPRAKVLRLSSEVYQTPSVAAAGIAAHEMGHALQDAGGYFPLQIRSAIVPVAQLGSTLAPWLFIAGFLLQLTTLAWVGVILFGGAALFTIVTLPVEIDASRRAKRLLVSNNILIGDEINGVNKVLDAAALTYVAAAVAAIGQLLYYVLLLSGGRRR